MGLSRGSVRNEIRHAEPPARLLATTPDADAVLLRADGPPRRPTDGKHRRVVAYAAPDVSRARLALLLRGLADELERHA